MATMPYETQLMTYDSLAESVENSAPDRGDKYLHRTFTEASDPAAASLAWKTHAVSYRVAGFVHDDAITAEGYLVPELDGSRGPHTDIYLAERPDKPSDISTIRKDNIAPGGSYRDLQAFKLCGDKLFPEGRAYLDGIENQEGRIKEIGALARSAEGHPEGAHELFRTIIHEAMGKNEVWFFTVVSSTYESLAKSYGRRNFQVIGEDVQIQDSRVNSEVRLRPTIVHPDQYIDNILASYLDEKMKHSEAAAAGGVRDARQAYQMANRLKHSLMYFTEGLREDQMSPLVAAHRRLFQAEAEVKRLTEMQVQVSANVGGVALAETA